MQVTVTDVAPTFTSASNFSVAENTTAAGTLTATDPGTSSITYAITGGADASLFNINASTGAITFKNAPNYESPADAGADNVYNLTVTASDGSQTTSRNMTVTVTNVNEAPTLNIAASVTVVEAAIAALATTFTGSDPDAGDTVTYSISGAQSDLFEIVGNNVQLKSGVALNHDVQSAYNLTVTATDSHGSTDSHSLTVNVGTESDHVNLVANGFTTDLDATGHVLGTADFSNGDNGITVNLATGANVAYTEGGNSTSVHLTAIDNVIGTSHDDTLTGDAGNNNIYGGDGNDTIWGGGGVNFLSGGNGNDIIHGTSGHDFMSGGAGDDIFYTSARGSDIISGGTGSDTVVFQAPGSIVLTGLSGIETLDFRNGGNDQVTINSTTLTSLAPETGTLTINHDAGDTITLMGATDTHSTTIANGITYNIFTMEDDHHTLINLHIQAA